VGAGISVALQQVLNANLRVESGSPWWAGFVGYLVGTIFKRLSEIVSEIDRNRQQGNLSSAIRLFVLDHYRIGAEPTPSGMAGVNQGG
jgi:uncharacterized membrane protein YdcZ (DUF606 family)